MVYPVLSVRKSGALIYHRPLLLMLLSILIGCDAQKPVNHSFSGVWDTQWGTIVLEQTGEQVTGTGRYQLEGTVRGN